MGRVYVFLDFFFLIFHSALVVFILIGWIWKPTRKAHFLLLSLTMISWFALGGLYGFGYCPCTDWHWQVKTKLGERNLPYSYVKYYADKATGLDSNPVVVDLLVLTLGLAAYGVSIYVNWRDWKG